MSRVQAGGLIGSRPLGGLPTAAQSSQSRPGSHSPLTGRSNPSCHAAAHWPMRCLPTSHLPLASAPPWDEAPIPRGCYATTWLTMARPGMDVTLPDRGTRPEGQLAQARLVTLQQHLNPLIRASPLHRVGHEPIALPPWLTPSRLRLAGGPAQLDALHSMPPGLGGRAHASWIPGAWRGSPRAARCRTIQCLILLE